MRVRAKIVICLLLCGVPLVLFAQRPASVQGEFLYKKANYASIFLHSDGWGVSYFNWRHKTYKRKVLFGVDVLNMKHPKEVKSFNVFNENSKGYVFGKLNYLYVIRPQFGYKKLLYDKLRPSGVEISYILTAGPSVGIARPVYLEILKFDQFVGIVPVEEKYNPEAHNIFNIYGRARGGKGWGEIKFHPGLFAKAGLNFEYGVDSDGIKSMEVGVTADVFPTRIPLMANIDNKVVFVSFYIALQIGKKDF